ncbi:MAG: hypothetical protein ACK5UQ_22890 [Planctomycetota bacterium]|jgi:hypothetical protein
MKLRAKLPDPTPPSKPAPARDPSVSHAARNLALAYRLDQLIQQGLLADYGAAAKLLGVSQPRLTHLMGLLLLAPQIQDAILAGTIAPGDKTLRRIARVADWREQLALLAG